MKTTNLNYLFTDQITNFAHLVTLQLQAKNEFLAAIKQNYSLDNPKTNLFYISCEKSDFITIRLNKTLSSILFNQ